MGVLRVRARDRNRQKSRPKPAEYITATAVSITRRAVALCSTGARLDACSIGHHNEPVSPALPSTPAARVLIVDDDVGVTDLFSRMLRLEGYEVWAAQSADDGLNLARLHRPHAIILDLRMPLTSGVQLLRSIRVISGLAQTPVAIVTGDYYMSDDQLNEIRSLGAELRYKPLWLDELVTLARELLTVQPVKGSAL